MLLASNNTVWFFDETSNTEDITPQIRSVAADVSHVHTAGDMDMITLKNGDLLIFRGSSSECCHLNLDEPITSLLPVGLSPLTVLVGTEGAHLHRFDKSTGKTAEVKAFSELTCRSKWNTPWGGPPAVRSLAKGGDGWVYADIHVGSIMRSPDLGKSWEPVTPQLNRDVHQVATCPASDTRVYANTAHAVYISNDCGASWDYAGSGLGDRYGRAIAVHPDDPNRILASVSDGPHGDNVHGQLYLSTDDGTDWLHVKGDFPESTRTNINTFHVTFAKDGNAWAVDENVLYVSTDGGMNWKKAWEAPTVIEEISCAD